VCKVQWSHSGRKGEAHKYLLQDYSGRQDENKETLADGSSGNIATPSRGMASVLANNLPPVSAYVATTREVTAYYPKDDNLCAIFHLTTNTEAIASGLGSWVMRKCLENSGGIKNCSLNKILNYCKPNSRP